MWIWSRWRSEGGEIEVDGVRERSREGLRKEIKEEWRVDEGEENKNEEY